MKKRILFISDIAPTSEFTAGIILERIVESFEQNFLLKFFVIHDRFLGNYTVSKSIGTSELYWTSKPREDWSPLATLPKLFTNLGERFAEDDAKVILEDIRMQISRERPDHIVIVIQGQTTILIADALQMLNIPTTYIHWDIWDWWAKSHGLSKQMDSTTKVRLNKIAELGYHLVPTAEFANFYGISSDRFVALYPSMLDERIVDVYQSAERIEIAFAGQGYAEREILSLITALDSIDWSVGGKSIVLNTFGNTQIKSTNRNANIINRGWFHYTQLPRAMANCHFAFLPYPSVYTMEGVAKTSFPSKLAAYSSGNLPVIYLGPKPTPTSSVSEQIGIALDMDVKSTEIIGAIKNILNNRREYLVRNTEIFNLYFSNAAFRKSLNEWLASNNLGQIPKTPQINSSRSFIRHIENYESFQELDRKKSENYFLFLRSIRDPKLLIRKIGKRIVKSIRKILR
jgi:hypothetical protein